MTSVDRHQAVSRAVEEWVSALTDLTGRNRLLFFKEQKRGTLNVTHQPRNQLEALLLGKRVDISKLFEPDEQENAAASARTIFAKSKANAEERGINTLLVTVGLLTWEQQKSRAAPSAPLFLIPLTLEPIGAAKNDFKLVADPSELMFNPSLEEYLRSNLQIELPPSLGDIDLGGSENLSALEHALETLPSVLTGVPGLSVDPQIVIGNFVYTKLPMVQDLKANLEALAANDLTAAFAGSPAAMDSLRSRLSEVPLDLPDRTATADEYLVLPADSSQQQAINRVRASQSLVIEGPPGTGKSQTIANLIASLASEGKTVLFVAEKRAAIEAVIGRLEDLGLDGLIQDLHSRSNTKREISRRLAEALERIGQVVAPDASKLHDDRDRSRDLLNGFARTMRTPVEPWAMSPYEVQLALLRVEPRLHARTKLSPSVISGIDSGAHDSLRESIAEFVTRGGLEIRPDTNPWGSAAIDSTEQAEWAIEAVADICTNQLPGAEQALTYLLQQTGLRAATTLAGWSEVFCLVESAVALEAVYDVEELWSADLGQLAADLAPAGRGAAARVVNSITNSRYRRAKKDVRRLAQDQISLSAKEHLTQTTRALELRQQWSAAAESPGLPRSASWLSPAEAAVDVSTQAISHLGSLHPGSDLLNVPSAELGPWLDRLNADSRTPSRLPRIRALRRELDRAGLSVLVDEMAGAADRPDEAVSRFDFAWLSGVWSHLVKTRSHLADFDGLVHEAAAERFRELDRSHLETNRTRVARVTAAAAIEAQNTHPDQAAEVKKEAMKKSKHLGLRELFNRAPDVLLAIKPCWTMSPLLVSQLLPGDRPIFDVVIFDEASQVQPADAMPALLRGKQAVFAGDRHQLPPTSFFDGADAVDGDDGIDGDGATQGMESILDAANTFMPPAMLLWHYRSRDDRLIAFSNSWIYGNALHTFPGCTVDSPVEFIAVKHDPARPAVKASSPPEVDAVVQMVLDHAAESPAVSLGVIAPGITHANEIEERLRLEVAGRPDLQGFFQEGGHEPFFVKNLERVQGDERDRIIFSLGYGKDGHGRLSHNFGPINNEGGQRRLNVAVTRAKSQMTMVASFTADDLDPNRSSAEGVRFLRNYLGFARSGAADLGERAPDHVALNPFELDVKDRLERRGIGLVPQVGASGYRIDFAAQHPDRPGQLVLAIECDGASYHSSHTARDRDRLRQEVLESKGWRFHRIWSTAWFNDPEASADETLAAFQRAVLDVDRRASRTDKPASISRPSTTASRRSGRIIDPGRPSIDHYSDEELVQLVRWVKSDGLLRTNADLFEEAFDHLGYSRRGSKIVERIETAIGQA